MYLSSINDVSNVDIDDSSQIRQENTPPATSNISQASSPSCPTLLVVDDNSNSNETSLNTTDIPPNSVLSPTQVNSTQTTSSSPLPITETSDGTPEQQRRRASSIAKLLGGQPLKNQQYEEINQQIIEDQSTQNVTTNSDNGTDNPLPRSRSSITRTLLMNTERNENTLTANANVRSTSPGFSKDFEYLIRRELDIEHSPSTLNRNSSTPSVFQSLISVRNTNNNGQSSSQSKLKRKRLTPKQTEPTLVTNNSSDGTSFSICEPFELNCSASSLSEPLHSTPIQHPPHHQNDLFRFDASHSSNPRHQNQSQYPLSMSNSAANSTSFTYPKLNLNSSLYAQFKIHHDRLSATACSPSSTSSSTYNYCRYPSIAELELPTPVSPLSLNMTSHPIIPHHTMPASSRKSKAIHGRTNTYEIPNQRSFSTVSNQLNASLSPSTSSSSHSVPLKKRLLHAYKNEQRPS